MALVTSWLLLLMWLVLRTLTRVRSCRFVIAVALASAIVGLPGARGLAQQSDKQRQLQQQLAETGTEEQAARAQLGDLQSQVQQFDSTLHTLESQVAAATSRLASAQAQSDRIAADVAALQVQIDQTRQALDVAKEESRQSAVLLYRHPHGQEEYLGLLGTPAASNALVEGARYLERVAEKRLDGLRRVGRLRDDLDSQQAQLADQKARADAARAAAANDKDAIDALYTRQQQARAASSIAASAYSTKLSELTAQQGQLEASLQQESDRIAEELRAAADDVAPGSGRFIRPVSGPITSPFGNRSDPLTGATTFHSGVDFGAPCGTPIKAAGDGVVFSAGPNGGYGNATIITHGGGLATLYGHQSSIKVTQGESVKSGEVIGLVGSTGRSTGCHLHWEVRVNGKPVEPTQYL
ncbi:MAG TPA: peptidoglycan DD-metalloendopeptidase family protein [Acidimicrobiia bacterium]